MNNNSNSSSITLFQVHRPYFQNSDLLKLIFGKNETETWHIFCPFDCWLQVCVRTRPKCLEEVEETLLHFSPGAPSVCFFFT